MRVWRAPAIACLLLAVAACGGGHRASEMDEAAAEAFLERWHTVFGLDVLTPLELASLTGQASPLEVLVEEGDSTLGTVVVVGQWHSSSDSLDTASGRESVARYQAAILDLLLDSGARHLFVEGSPVGETLPSDPATDSVLRELFRQPLDPDSFFGVVSEWQFKMLTMNGAVPMTYRALRPGTSVWGADENEDTLRSALAGTVSEPWDSLTQSRRERLAMTTIVRHLERHPGSTAHLIYGAAHLFDRGSVPAGSRVPRIVRVTFPGLLIAATEVQPIAGVLLEDDPPALGAYLDALEFVTPDLYEILEAGDQLRALRRPILLTEDEADGDALERRLLKDAKSREVRDSVKAGGWSFVPDPLTR